ncbi:hypothetical protein Droror1_Dr00003705 [Drosera rotundifolia]
MSYVVGSPSFTSFKLNVLVLSQAVSRVQVTTMSVKDNLLVASGFRGELICKYLNQAGVAFSTKLTADDAIRNAVDIFSSSKYTG